MRNPMAILVAMASPLMAEPGQAAASAERLAQFRKQAEAITERSTQTDVISALGKPQLMRTGKIRKQVGKYLYYLDYTDDSVHRSFRVFLPTGGGCTVSSLEISREELRKTPLLVATGTVQTVYTDYPEKGGDGFLCDVIFQYDGHTITKGVAVATKARVKGSPEVGATIRLEHRSENLDFIFTGQTSLYLESIVFTGKTDRPVR